MKSTSKKLDHDRTKFDRDQKLLCGARTQSGSLCDRVPAPGRRRCRLHGGAPGSGAPVGSANGRSADGNYTKEAKAERRLVRQILAGRGERDMANSQPSDVMANGALPTAGGEKRRRVTAHVYQSGGVGQFSATAPAGQTDEEWTMRLRCALGSHSKCFVDASLQRLMAACCPPRQAIPTSVSVSAALAIIESLEPKNEIEAALAVEIACLQAVCGTLLARLIWTHQDRSLTVAANAIARLERALHSAIRTYMLFKHGNTQVIRIERLEIRGAAQAVL